MTAHIRFRGEPMEYSHMIMLNQDPQLNIEQIAYGVFEVMGTFDELIGRSMIDIDILVVFKNVTPDIPIPDIRMVHGNLVDICRGSIVDMDTFYMKNGGYCFTMKPADAKRTRSIPLDIIDKSSHGVVFVRDFVAVLPARNRVMRVSTHCGGTFVWWYERYC